MNRARHLFARIKTVLSGSSVQTTKTITVVSGLPRSGTSMMMKMLEAVGLPPLTDEVRAADVDNPKGYYEFERVKKLDKGDTAWLPAAQGKVVKIISMLLQHLPAEYDYQVIFMRRDLQEVLASQKRMLAHRDKPADAAGDEEMMRLFAKHLAQVEVWLAQQANFKVQYVDYNALLENPSGPVRQINRFLGGRLDEAAMAGVVDPNLYRQRR